MCSLRKYYVSTCRVIWQLTQQCFEHLFVGRWIVNAKHDMFLRRTILDQRKNKLKIRLANVYLKTQNEGLVSSFMQFERDTIENRSLPRTAVTHQPKRAAGR